MLFLNQMKHHTWILVHFVFIHFTLNSRACGFQTLRDISVFIKMYLFHVLIFQSTLSNWICCIISCWNNRLSHIIPSLISFALMSLAKWAILVTSKCQCKKYRWQEHFLCFSELPATAPIWCSERRKIKVIST